MDVVVYSPPSLCPKCVATKIRLKKERIPFREVVMTAEQIETFKAGGHQSSPVVVVDLGDGATWTFSDYRHEDITRLKQLYREAITVAA